MVDNDKTRKKNLHLVASVKNIIRSNYSKRAIKLTHI